MPCGVDARSQLIKGFKKERKKHNEKKDKEGERAKEKGEKPVPPKS